MRGAKPSKIIAFPGGVGGKPKAPPSWLPKFAKLEWKRVLPPLTQRRILSTADYGCLEAYCLAIGQVREMSEEIASLKDRYVYSEGGAPRPHPAFRMRTDAIGTARQLAAELGLTPVSRSRAHMTPKADDNDNGWARMDL